ncbi:hypothetical protein TIFTF001_005146 [Ficus carica]|uniref:Uncharacterized protein n=1 Tax=Ficus carica TaxID=3494 RepID=A0AA88DEA2_FICCA|nr:hypothetical protein TIFTF001_005146 [Ficus carica]
MWGRRRSSVGPQDSQAQLPKREMVSAPTSVSVSGSGSGSSSAQGKIISSHWSVFDGVKTIPATPEALMDEIDSAISNLELARATALLRSPSPSPSSSPSGKKKSPNVTTPVQYDVRMADEAFKAGCSALAAGKLDEALHSLNVSLSKCPPDKTSAVAKLQSLITLTSQQLQRSSN